MEYEGLSSARRPDGALTTEEIRTSPTFTTAKLSLASTDDLSAGGYSPSSVILISCILRRHVATVCAVDSVRACGATQIAVQNDVDHPSRLATFCSPSSNK